MCSVCIHVSPPDTSNTGLTCPATSFTMSETDHNQTQPALPILGSVLLQNELKARRRFASHGERICTGCAEIDDHVLVGGGFERGIVVGINGIDEAGRLVSLQINGKCACGEA